MSKLVADLPEDVKTKTPESTKQVTLEFRDAAAARKTMQRVFDQVEDLTSASN